MKAMSEITRERPILFSGPMVRAILDGHKTQTRRVASIPPQPIAGARHPAKHAAPYFDAYCGASKTAQNPRGMTSEWCWWQVDDRVCLPHVRCPYGVPGDRLWVRETFASSQKCLVAYRADGECGAWMGDGGGGRIWNRHGGIVGAEFHRFEDWRGQTFGLSRFGGQWKPSIHMPRWASRLTLEVTEVRVQRLQDISEEDCRAEGVDWATPQPFGEEWGDDDREDPREVGYGSGSFARDNFRRLWDSINARRGHSWESNPFVWALTFKVLP